QDKSRMSSANATHVAKTKNRNVAFTIAFSTAPESPRSCHVETSCRPERLWQGRRAISRDRFRRSSTDKAEPGLSLFSDRRNLDPNNDVQTERLCEIFGGL